MPMTLLLTSSVAARFGRHGMPPPASNPDLCLTLKLVCKSHLRRVTFLPNLGTLGLCVLELFTMYATDEQTDGQMDKSNTYCPLRVRGIRSIRPSDAETL